MKIRIKFSKQGAMKFIGHLDTMRYFQKAMRRADVDIRYSEGFSPHQIMSFAAPLGVGLTGSGEYLDIEVLSTDSSVEMVKRLNETMVEGVEVLSYRLLPDNAENAMSIVAACDYTFVLRDDYENGLSMTAEEFYTGTRHQITDLISPPLGSCFCASRFLVFRIIKPPAFQTVIYTWIKIIIEMDAIHIIFF